MSVHKESDGKWSVLVRYTDFKGTRKQKHKRGFTLKKEAEAWERDFLARQAGQPSMSFGALRDLYLEDVKTNNKAISYRTKESWIRCWITPYFDKQAVNEITPADIRKWQNTLKTAKNKKEKPLSPAYMQNIVVQMSSIFEFAVRFYGLSSNPCKVAGNTVGKKTKSVNFWTYEEFKSFLEAIPAGDPFRILFSVLYYTGMRIGELQALTPADIDLAAGTIRINKTFHVINGEHVVTPPKTAKSNRVITIPPFLGEEIREYMGRCYGLQDEDRIFTYGDSYIDRRFHEAGEAAGLRRIRIHDLRHSHASLLIHLGFSAVLVSERLGHESVSTTLNIYAHLYPSTQSEVAARLQELGGNKMVTEKQADTKNEEKNEENGQ